MLEGMPPSSINGIRMDNTLLNSQPASGDSHRMANSFETIS